MRLTYSVHTKFDRGYIAHPYWPERERLINLEKQSGVNRARSEANRRKALEEYFQRTGMTNEDYERLKAKAAQPFYLNGANIIIPELHVTSFLVATSTQARAATRACDPEQVRSRFIATPWDTGKTKADGIYSRFAQVTAGTGAKLSNQRGLRENEYIEHFTGVGSLTFDDDFVDPESLRRMIEWGGLFVGIGACRKMGWGRFTLEGFEKQ